MSEKTKNKKKNLSDMSFVEALARFIETNPKELAERVAGDVVKQRKRAERRIRDAEREIEDGARPKKGRFRL